METTFASDGARPVKPRLQKDSDEESEEANCEDSLGGYRYTQLDHEAAELMSTVCYTILGYKYNVLVLVSVYNYRVQVLYGIPLCTSIMIL